MSTLPQQLERVIFALCEDTGTPIAHDVMDAVRKKEYRRLVDMTIDPGTYQCADSYRKDAVVVELLRKFGDFEIPGVDKRAAALNSFFESEKANYVTNARLAPFLSNGPFEDPRELRMFESIERMQRWIAAVLGPLPKEVNARHGPGSTFRDVGKYITVPDKLSSRPTVTQACVDLVPMWRYTWWAKALLESYPGHSEPEVIRGNRFTAVPKNSKTLRGICIEGSINVYFQLGVGAHLKTRLKLVGIDMEKSQDIHRRYAELASRTGEYATIDLSSASDRNARNFVKLLLAKAGGWYDLLDSLRSPMTMVDGKWHRLEKFSSMGNGFTFELETLLFLAIGMEACFLSNINAIPGVSLFVYGDDIILPSSAGATMLTLLKFFGHKPNENKTFLEGSFRESCGGDYFDGKAVRPHYLEETPDEPAKWISLANGIRRLGSQNPHADFRGSIYWRAWLRALDAIPSDIRRLRGPEDLGDLVIHDSPEFWQKRRTTDCRTFVRTWMPIRRPLQFHHWKPAVVLASALYGVDQDGVVPRDGVTGFRKKWVAYAQ